jgi:hypothetical protein
MKEDFIQIVIKAPNPGMKRRLSALGRQIEKKIMKEPEAIKILKMMKARRKK